MPVSNNFDTMDFTYFFRQMALIIASPQKAWTPGPAAKLGASNVRNSLLLPLLLLVTVCAFLGSILLENVTMKTSYSILVGIRFFLLDLFTVYLSALILREILKAMDLASDYSTSFTLIVFSLVPFFICQMISLFFESFAFVNILALYGLWIFRAGSEILLNPAGHKKTPLLIAVFVVITELYIGLNLALSSIFTRIYFGFFN